MIRWYAINPLTNQRHLSALSDNPVIFYAPDKPSARAYLDEHLPSCTPMSVVEWEAVREMESAARRFLDSCDRDRARAIAREMAEGVLLTGQGDLLAVDAPWLERVA